MVVFFLLILVGLIYSVVHLYMTTFLPFLRIKRKLQKQGIKGPSPSFLYGNLPEMKQINLRAMKSQKMGESIGHDYTSTIFPYFEHWRKEYGLVYTYSTQFKQHLYINDPELVKEMNHSITLDLGKPTYLSARLEPVFGNGITRSNGHRWAQQRKIIAPEFFIDKVKGMVGLMVESTQPMLKKWEECIEYQGGIQAEINVDQDLRGLSADVIARACFGSSYIKGKEIFSKLRNLQTLLTKHGLLFGFTSFGFYPNKNRRKISKLKREIETLIWDTVIERERQSLGKCSIEKDLMQLILEGAVNEDKNKIEGDEVSPKSFIVDNCKTMYFSGHESTAIAASWCLMLLGLYPEWQSRVRDEVNKCCAHGFFDANAVSNLKTMNMVIQEAIRLYPPGAFVSREALEELQIGHITIPKGVCIWTFIPSLHRDPNVWGPEANEFKPERFADGVSKACKYPQAYIPFGLGTRLCLGKHFALFELKVVLSLIVSKFSFSLSPNYKHSPTFRMLVEPEHGVQILIQKV